ncbi:outer membrane protein assembly factor BamB family protein [Brachybacterium hainanense]|uniref:PQQ-binding-like beta-propeller repeat protein n=1 Tax=Brachybacterium hainanense TaxID=1541174 RepID=A0ABV6RF72_9MICO
MSPAAPPDRTVLPALALAALALAGVGALLGEHLLLGPLRLLAGLLAALGLALLVLALPLPRRRPLAALVAAAAALALTVPAVLAHRSVDLADAALASLPPLQGGDRVIVGADEASPVLIDRASGEDTLLDPASGRTAAVEAQGAEPLLAADGSRLLLRRREATTVLDSSEALARTGGDGTTVAASAPSGSRELPGSPLALDGDLLVMQSTERPGCVIRGYDLAEQAAAPVWTVRDPGAADCPVGAAPEDEGVLPRIAVRTDSRQGLVQIDPRTGFVLGGILSRPGTDCTAQLSTGPADAGQHVVLVCAARDGALTARALAAGNELWRTEPSPAGSWETRVEDGRVLARGTEQGTDVSGELVASEASSSWTAPGGDGGAGLRPARARIGMDGAQMILVDTAGQVSALDTATGRPRWTVPLSSPQAPVTGALAHGTAVLLDPAPRAHALAPRDASRLRILDPAGRQSVELTLEAAPAEIRPLPGGRALLTDDGALLLIGPESG